MRPAGRGLRGFLRLACRSPVVPLADLQRVEPVEQLDHHLTLEDRAMLRADHVGF